MWNLGDPAAEADPKPTRTLRGLEPRRRPWPSAGTGRWWPRRRPDGAYAWRAGADDRPKRVVTGPAVAVAARGDDLVVATEDGRLVWLGPEDRHGDGTRWPR